MSMTNNATIDTPTTMTPREELAFIDKEIERLEKRRGEIYAASLEAPAEEKVCTDDLANLLAHVGSAEYGRFHFPIEVTGFAYTSVEPLRKRTFGAKAGDLVAVRPCAEEHQGKTFLGIMIGDFALSYSVSYNRTTGVLTIGAAMHNPAMFVPDLGKIVFGCGSWWRKIATPEDLQQITDVDIHSTWYVQAIRSLTEQNRQDTKAQPE